MIRGGVNHQLEPRFSLIFLDSSDSPLLMDVTVDTVFTGFLALPSAVIAQLGLFPIADFPIELADGSVVRKSSYEARFEWNGTVRIARVIELETDPIIGTRLLWGHRLSIDMIVGGEVTLSPLP